MYSNILVKNRAFRLRVADNQVHLYCRSQEGFGKRDAAPAQVHLMNEDGEPTPDALEGDGAAIHEQLAIVANHKFALTCIEPSLIGRERPGHVGFGIHGDVLLFELKDHVQLLAGHTAFGARAASQNQQKLGRFRYGHPICVGRRSGQYHHRRPETAAGRLEMGMSSTQHCHLQPSYRPAIER